MSDGGPRVALTFDAEHPDRSRCPPDAPARVLDALAEAGVRATFFIQARWATSAPALARRIVDDGHRVGHHSKFHAPMPLLTDDGVRADIREGAEEILAVTGADPRPWFRCPFGAGWDDRRILALLAELGYRNVHWHVEAQDWEPDRSADDVRAAVVEGVARHGDGCVVLLHTWPAPTATALPRIVQDLAARGSRFVTLDELAVHP